MLRFHLEHSDILRFQLIQGENLIFFCILRSSKFYPSRHLMTSMFNFLQWYVHPICAVYEWLDCHLPSFGTRDFRSLYMCKSKCDERAREKTGE